MKLQERCFSTKLFRPKPIIHLGVEGSLMIITHVWGQNDHAQNVIGEIEKYVSGASSEVEVTSPFEFMSCLSQEVNYVRTGILLANEMLYRSINKSQYATGVEVLALYKRGSQLAWAQVGCPSLYLHRVHRGVQPLAVTQDLSAELSIESEILPPMPGHLIGLESTCHVSCGETTVRDGDSLILLSGGMVPELFFSGHLHSPSFNEISELIIQKSPESPFWLGLVGF
jgi:hypothetical protein